LREFRKAAIENKELKKLAHGVTDNWTLTAAHNSLNLNFDIKLL
jgi:hypothetical protein